MSSRAPIGHLAIAGCVLYTNQGCKSFVPINNVLDSEFQLAEVETVRKAAEMQLAEIKRLPTRLLTKAFKL